MGDQYPDRSKFTLSRLENMWYKIDSENAIRYAEFLRSKSPQPQWFRTVLLRLHGTRAHKPIEFMTWRLIVRLAEYVGVPPELFVDEDYYFNKYGIAGYRLMFEAHRRGVSLAELTENQEKGLTEKNINTWYKTWYNVLKGCINSTIHGRVLTRVLIQCYEKLGVPLGTILGKQLHSNAEAVGIQGELTDVMTTLGRRECAFVAGVAKAVSYHCMNRDNDVLVGDINKLLGWYFGSATVSS